MSGPQTELARKKLSDAGNVEIITAAFLNFDPGGRKFTKGFSRKALHHLTNTEKETFLLRISGAFEKNALFLLEDGIFFDFPRTDIEKNMPALLKDAERYYGSSWEQKKKDIIHSFTQEFPAGASEWTEFFAKAGFKVIKRIPKCSFYGTLMAVKE